MTTQPLCQSEQGKITLNSATALPNASGYLWNKCMMMNMNCRGFAIAQFMQPEPAKYSNGPCHEAKNFMQPEHQYYPYHPGRFFYCVDHDNNTLFSVPFDPVKKAPDCFQFMVEQHQISWRVTFNQLTFVLSVTLTIDEPIELWQLTIENEANHERNISIYPYFSIGYQSWMNQSAVYQEALSSIVASRVTPYQKVEDYPKQKEFLDKTFLLCEQKPMSWCASQLAFEGAGDLREPESVLQPCLPNQQAQFENAVAVVQYHKTLAPKEKTHFRFIFGAVKSEQQIARYQQLYFNDGGQGFIKAATEYQQYIASGSGSISISTPNKGFNEFVNYWLPRQVFYHGDVNRLSTDPQTRNYLQDAMGMVFVNPKVCRTALLTALAQQSISGELPDGILLHPDAELKYINQVPHADHSIWPILCLSCYLNETNDTDILTKALPYADSSTEETVAQHINKAVDYLLLARDERGLSYIQQGDWCDPMNMVGYLGKGVSSWLTFATAFAIKTWLEIINTFNLTANVDYLAQQLTSIQQAGQQHFWDEHWFARGINDFGRKFGIASDSEGKMYLNAQSWAILSDTATKAQQEQIIEQVEQQLASPHGMMMLAPSYTKMDEGIGRLTQKHPGVSENGSVYNHAAIFYIVSLFQCGQTERAIRQLMNMIPQVTDNDDLKTKGQLPNFIPNYYRGAYYQFPEYSGKSSQLFNTGTVAWYYRCVIEYLFGLKGSRNKKTGQASLMIEPKLPNDWNSASVKRQFSGATFNVNYQKNEQEKLSIFVDDIELIGNEINDIRSGCHYNVSVFIPK